MIWGTIERKEKILNIVQSLIIDEIGITVKLRGEQPVFTSRFIGVHAEKRNGSGEVDEPELIIERLAPGRGNVLIQSSPEASLHFFFDKNFYRFTSRCMGTSNAYPSYGFLLRFPRSLQFRERRSEERSIFEKPDLISAEFTLTVSPSRSKIYALRVHDYSKHGVGLIITENEFDLVDVLAIGDSIDPISFYTSEAIITNVRGVVRHITRIGEGPYEGCYMLGIESRDIIPINETLEAIL